MATLTDLYNEFIEQVDDDVPLQTVVAWFNAAMRDILADVDDLNAYVPFVATNPTQRLNLSDHAITPIVMYACYRYKMLEGALDEAVTYLNAYITAKRRFADHYESTTKEVYQDTSWQLNPPYPWWTW